MLNRAGNLSYHSGELTFAYKGLEARRFRAKTKDSALASFIGALCGTAEI